MLVDFDFLAECVKHNINVMMIGHRGVGKTTIIRKVFSDAGRKLKVLSGSNLDPYLEFVGIPKEEGESFKMILPEWLYSNQYDSLFVDEVNRARPAVFNALLEIIQFGTMHGKDLGIKTVWVAMNPHDSREHNYQVSVLDPALEDRFPVKIEVPYELNVEYLSSKYPILGQVAAEFWNFNCDERQQLDFSPRQLDEVLNLYKLGLPIHYSVPKSINSSALSSLLLQAEPTENILNRFMNKQDFQGLTTYLQNDNNYNNALPILAKNEKLASFCLPMLGVEKLSSLVVDKKYVSFVTKAVESNLAAFNLDDLIALSEGDTVFSKLRDIKKDGSFINNYVNKNPHVRYSAELLDNIQEISYQELNNILNNHSYSIEYKLSAIAGFVGYDYELCKNKDFFKQLLVKYENFVSQLILESLTRNISLLHNVMVSYAANHGITLDRCNSLIKGENNLVILDSLFIEDSQKLIHELP